MNARVAVLRCLQLTSQQRASINKTPAPEVEGTMPLYDRPMHEPSMFVFAWGIACVAGMMGAWWVWSLVA